MKPMDLGEHRAPGCCKDWHFRRAWLGAAARTDVIPVCDALPRSNGGTELKSAVLALALFLVNEVFLFIELSNLVLPLAL